MARVVRRADQATWKQRARTMHGTSGGWQLAAGRGKLIRQDGTRVNLNDKPGNRQPRRP